MASPPSGGPKVKQEEEIPWRFEQNETVNLDSDAESDAEDDDFSVPARSSKPTVKSLRNAKTVKKTGTPQNTTSNATSHMSAEALGTEPGTANTTHSKQAGKSAMADAAASSSVDLGSSMFSRAAGGNNSDFTQKMLEAQRAAATKFLARRSASSILASKDDHEEQTAESVKAAKNAEDPAASGFAQLKAKYERSRKAGATSIAHDIEIMKAEAAETQRLRKIEADAEYDKSPSPEPKGLFLNEDEDAPAASEPYSALYADDEIEEIPPPKKRKRAPKDNGNDDASAPKCGRPKGTRAGKKSSIVPGTGYTEEDVDEVLQNTNKGKSGTKSAKRGARKPKNKIGAPPRREAPEMTNLGSVFGTNVFSDAAVASSRPAAAEHSGGGRRDAALRQLIASVPDQERGQKRDAHADKRYLNAAIKSFTGTNPIRAAPDGNWKLKGMRTTLKHYQVLGTSFMRKRESGAEPRGGILADQVGLGKTLMSLANIVNGLPPEKSRRKATLVIASPNLITQWWREINDHVETKRENKHHGIGRFIRYKSSRDDESHNDIIEHLSESHIVLSTWYELQKSWPKVVPPPELVTAEQKNAWWKDHLEKERGVLHRVEWLRVVLDEAQAIKNHKSHTSLAARGLESRHRWAISGTPILNTLAEMYPYFKFLKVPQSGSYRIFKQNFCTAEDPDGVNRLNVFLRKIMIRRTHVDTLFNARLLDLPTPKEHTLWLEFGDVERQIYDIVRDRFAKHINMISKQNGLERQYSHVWTLILRLRQLCSHPLLIQGPITDLLEREDFEKLNRITADEDDSQDQGASLLFHLRQVLKNNTGVNDMNSDLKGAIISEDRIATVDVTNYNDILDQTGNKHGLKYKFRKYLDNLKSSDHWHAISQRCLCTGCRQQPENPFVTSCFHIYCHSCLTDLQHMAARRGHDQARCSECGEAYSSAEPCQEIEEFQDSGSSAESVEGSSSQESKKGKKSKKKSEGDWISLPGEILPSAKTQATKAQLLNWIEDDPNCKCIVFTQFLDMVRVLSKVCKTEEWGYVTYSGKMSHESRDKAVREFETDPTKRVMLASLKSGGLGLNLTMASKVICLDPWWNNAVEQQAFCRVFRIGQTKETEMVRFVVSNTIDSAMMAMKERKTEEIDQVMEEARKKDIPDVSELLRLFGEVGEDDEGHAFIFVDDPKENEARHAESEEENEEGVLANEP
ncbi:hypothetical protein D0863_05687 [Hortaea werneckii]|uniref:RING-type domain-containing protein n=1 Tax=Hortaea werneckii TaxID=91943 RepID=A0A3M7E219_HORWE|nr:hypothetical protein D0863_05687 [Hortaea werneckii]